MEIEKALHYLKTIADQYGKAKAEAEYLREFRKTKKAMLMIEAEQDGIKTVAAQESYAYAHDDYMELLDGLRVAIQESERLSMLVRAATIQIDIWKTNQMREMSEAKLR